MNVHVSEGNVSISDRVNEIEITTWQTDYDRQPIVVIGDIPMMLEQWITITSKVGVMLHELQQRRKENAT